MAKIKAGADNVGTLELLLEMRRGVIIDSLPEPVRSAIVEKMGRNLIILADLQLIALESASPMDTFRKIDAHIDAMQNEIGILQRPSSRSKKKHH